MLADDRDDDAAFGGFGGEVPDAAGACHRDVERLLDDDVLAGRDGLFRELHVQAARGADDDEVDEAVRERVRERGEFAGPWCSDRTGDLVGERDGRGRDRVDDRCDREIRQ